MVPKIPLVNFDGPYGKQSIFQKKFLMGNNHTTYHCAKLERTRSNASTWVGAQRVSHTNSSRWDESIVVWTLCNASNFLFAFLHIASTWFVVQPMIGSTYMCSSFGHSRFGENMEESRWFGQSHYTLHTGETPTDLFYEMNLRWNEMNIFLLDHVLLIEINFSE